MMRQTALQRENLCRIRRDRQRPLRVLEYLDNSAIFANSPVEVKEGYVVSDRDNGDLFLVLVFRSLSYKPIAALDIRVLFYNENHPTPFRKDDFRYSWEHATLGERVLNGEERREKECRKEQAIVHGEEFGQGVFLPLPENYFHKMQIELVGVAYTVGEYQPLGLIAGNRAKRFADIDFSLRLSYAQVNIFERVEESHPIRVLPQAGENVWLCCCGHKNPAAASFCEDCGRDRDWQMENLSVERLEQTREKLEAEEQQRIESGEKRVLHDASAYTRYDKMESDEEKQRKVEKYNVVLQHLAAQEKAKEHRRKMILPKLALLALLVFAIWFLAEWLGYIGR